MVVKYTEENVMNITGVKVERCTSDVKDLGLVAVCSVTFDYSFRVNDIRLKNGKKGYYVLFPADDYNMGIAFPIKDDMRTKIMDRILSELESC
jgi:DNA-binding cell septation regulator SpoVG